jgi:methylase of polypeptide subunit release factors
MDASQTSSKYYTHYGLNIQQINTAFFNNTVIDEVGFKLKPEIIVFNPPYVPVEQEEIENERKYLKNKLKFVK